MKSDPQIAERTPEASKEANGNDMNENPASSELLSTTYEGDTQKAVDPKADETLKRKEAMEREKAQPSVVQTGAAYLPKDETPAPDNSNDLSLEDSKVIISTTDQDAQIKAKAASTKSPSQDFSSLSLSDTHTVIATADQDDASKERIVKETVLEQQRGVSVPGAFGSQPTYAIGVSNVNGSFVTNRDEETGMVTEQAAAQSSEFLVKAELVDDASSQKEDKLLVDAEVLQQEDPIIKRRRRRLSIAGIIGALIIVIVLAVSLSLRNDDGGSNSSAQTTKETILASTSPTISVAPSMEPSTAPSISPSDFPSQSPTRNTWEFVQKLPGIEPLEPSAIPLGGAAVGTSSHISDISETPLANRTGKNYMVVAVHGDGTVIANGPAIFFLPRAASIYLCQSEQHQSIQSISKNTDPCELTAFLEGINVLATAVRGTFFILHAQMPDLRVALFDLSNIDQLSDPVEDTPSPLNISLFATETEYDRVALNEDTNGILSLRPSEKNTLTIGLDPFEVVSETSQPPTFFEAPFSLFFTMASGGSFSVTIEVSNKNPAPPCIGGITCDNTFYDDQIAIERREIPSGEFNPAFEVDLKASVWSKKGIAVNSDATILALSSASVVNTNTVNFQVDVFELVLVNATSVWKPMGSTLFSSSSNDFFGESLAINAEGNFLVVGANQDSENGQDAGKVYSFVWDGSDWSLFEEPLKGEAGSRFGSSLDLSPDGRLLVVGAPDADTNGNGSGEVLIYKIQGI